MGNIEIKNSDITIKALVRAMRLGKNTVFIVEDLTTSQLICIAKLAENTDEVNIGESGELTYTFIDNKLDENKKYEFSGNYFQAFIPNVEKIVA
jgi:hypothetical protein